MIVASLHRGVVHLLLSHKIHNSFLIMALGDPEMVTDQTIRISFNGDLLNIRSFLFELVQH